MADGKRKKAGASSSGPTASLPQEKKLGRPSIYSIEIADEICLRLSQGESLRKICKDERMPGRVTVLEWLKRDSNFRAKYSRSREDQTDWLVEDMEEIEEGVLNGEIDAQSGRVVLWSRQWRAAKLAPKKYSDKLLNEHSGPDGGAIKVESTVIDSRSMSPEDREAFRQLLLKAKAKESE